MVEVVAQNRSRICAGEPDEQQPIALEPKLAQ